MEQDVYGFERATFYKDARMVLAVGCHIDQLRLCYHSANNDESLTICSKHKSSNNRFLELWILSHAEAYVKKLNEIIEFGKNNTEVTIIFVKSRSSILNRVEVIKGKLKRNFPSIFESREKNINELQRSSYLWFNEMNISATKEICCRFRSQSCERRENTKATLTHEKRPATWFLQKQLNTQKSTAFHNLSRSLNRETVTKDLMVNNNNSHREKKGNPLHLAESKIDLEFQKMAALKLLTKPPQYPKRKSKKVRNENDRRHSVEAKRKKKSKYRHRNKNSDKKSSYSCHSRDGKKRKTSELQIKCKKHERRRTMERSKADATTCDEKSRNLSNEAQLKQIASRKLHTAGKLRDKAQNRINFDDRNSSHLKCKETKSASTCKNKSLQQNSRRSVTMTDLHEVRGSIISSFIKLKNKFKTASVTDNKNENFNQVENKGEILSKPHDKENTFFQYLKRLLLWSSNEKDKQECKMEVKEHKLYEPEHSFDIDHTLLDVSSITETELSSPKKLSRNHKSDGKSDTCSLKDHVKGRNDERNERQKNDIKRTESFVDLKHQTQTRDFQKSVPKQDGKSRAKNEVSVNIHDVLAAKTTKKHTSSEQKEKHHETIKHKNYEEEVSVKKNEQFAKNTKPDIKREGEKTKKQSDMSDPKDKSKRKETDEPKSKSTGNSDTTKISDKMRLSKNKIDVASTNSKEKDDRRRSRSMSNGTASKLKYRKERSIDENTNRQVKRNGKVAKVTERSGDENTNRQVKRNGEVAKVTERYGDENTNRQVKRTGKMAKVTERSGDENTNRQVKRNGKMAKVTERSGDENTNRQVKRNGKMAKVTERSGDENTNKEVKRNGEVAMVDYDAEVENDAKGTRSSNDAQITSPMEEKEALNFSIRLKNEKGKKRAMNAQETGEAMKTVEYLKNYCVTDTSTGVLKECLKKEDLSSDFTMIDDDASLHSSIDRESDYELSLYEKKIKRLLRVCDLLCQESDVDDLMTSCDELIVSKTHLTTGLLFAKRPAKVVKDWIHGYSKMDSQESFQNENQSSDNSSSIVTDTSTQVPCVEFYCYDTDLPGGIDDLYQEMP